MKDQVNTEEETITIPKSLYDELFENSCFLAALEVAGVDEWSGYKLVQEILPSRKFN